MSTPKSALNSAVKVYHDIWSAVATYFYDRERLRDWQFWEHSFDDQIDSEATALIYARLMVGSLKDRFTSIEVSSASNCSAESDAAALPAGSTTEENRISCLRTPSNIGYIRILNFDADGMSKELWAAIEKLAGCDGIMLDLRHNAGGIMEQALESAEIFIEEGPLATIERTVDGGIRIDERYVAPDGAVAVINEPGKPEEVFMFPRLAPLLARTPCVILISGKTASAAELLAAAIIESAAANNIPCKTVGTRTSGKATVQHHEPITERISLTVTRGRYLSPSDVWFGDAGQTVSNGLEPNVHVAHDTGTEGLVAAKEQLRELIVGHKAAL